MIKGRLTTYKTTNGGEIHRLVMIVKNETVHPVTVGTINIPYCSPGLRRRYERIKVNRAGTVARWVVYDEPLVPKEVPVVSRRIIPPVQPVTPESYEQTLARLGIEPKYAGKHEKGLGV